ncbi:hypothetical protein [Thalassobaculum sp.]|uniref:hypothetical protein n=1 Tax=Thalassobaculum sp. TaxID=2022740 RepID=UPI0032ED3A4B
MIVSVHIPKAAGTSLRIALERRLGRRLLLDYNDRPLRRTPKFEARRARRAAAVRAKADRLLRRYRAVHGHFAASKYLPLGPQARFAVFLREPVARTLSHYRHWRRMPDAPNPIARRIFKQKLGPGDLAEMPEYRWIYADFLGGMTLDDFAFVGIAEEYETSLELFRAVLGLDLPVLRENTADASEDTEFPPDEIARVKAAQAGNSVLYDHARRRFDELCSKFL